MYSALCCGPRCLAACLSLCCTPTIVQPASHRDSPHVSRFAMPQALRCCLPRRAACSRLQCYLHSRILLQENSPVDASSFSKLVKRCTSRVAKKQIPAHMLRDIAITSLMSNDALTQKQAHSWANSMQHGIATQRRICDRTSGIKRIAPACDMAGDLFKQAAKRTKRS